MDKDNVQIYKSNQLVSVLYLINVKISAMIFGVIGVRLYMFCICVSLNIAIQINLEHVYV